MTEPTALDALWRAAQADPGLRARFYDALAATRLHVPLTEDETAPLAFDLSDGRAMLAFDDDGRMADFLGRPTAYAAAPGAEAAGWAAQAGLRMGLNFGAPSAMLLDVEAVRWLAAREAPRIEAEAVSGGALAPPADAAPAALAALAAAAEAAPSRVAELWLARLRRGDESPLLAVVVPRRRREGEALAEALARAAAVAGAPVDVAPAARGSALLRAARAVGLPLAAPEPPAPSEARPEAAPPRLR